MQQPTSEGSTAAAGTAPVRPAVPTAGDEEVHTNATAPTVFDDPPQYVVGGSPSDGPEQADGNGEVDPGVTQVNWLLAACNIDSNRPIVDLRQCSSSLFVLLFKRIFGLQLEGLELEPDTHEKKLYNMRAVLRELEMILHQPLDTINAEEIVNLNRDHIRHLISVFMHVHQAMEQQQQQQQQEEEAAAAVNGQLQAQWDDDLPSSVDSANATHRLVSDWKRDVQPPPRRKVGQRVDPMAIAALDEQLRRIEQFTGRRPRPRRHLSRNESQKAHRLEAVQHRREMTALANAQRDARIESLRCNRFVAGLERDIRSAIIADKSRAEVAAHAALKTKLRQQRRDLIEMKRAAYDEDQRYRKAYSTVVASMSHHFRTEATLLHEKTVDVARRSAEATREARRTGREYAKMHRQQLNGEYSQYVNALHSWRNSSAFE